VALFPVALLAPVFTLPKNTLVTERANAELAALAA
jgi:hypothetical protein